MYVRQSSIAGWIQYDVIWNGQSPKIVNLNLYMILYGNPDQSSQRLQHDNFQSSEGFNMNNAKDFLFLIFGGQKSFFVGPLIALFWSSGNVCVVCGMALMSVDLLHVFSLM